MEDQKMRMMSVQQDPTSSETIPSFLLKTYQILQNQKYSDIICWTRSGEGFIVKKVKEFSENILPIYFRHSNYTSFVRQLNMYDFHKTRQQNHQNAFKNLMFKKGYKHLLKDIQRKDYKKNKENGREGASAEKGLQKSMSFSRNQKQIGLNKNQSKQTMKKINQISTNLEKKALALAELKQIPQTQTELLKILDILFDAKKMHGELIQKMETLTLSSPSSENKGLPIVQLKFDKTAEKMDPPSEFNVSEAKEKMTAAKQDQIGTTVSLFSSFNQI